MVEEEGRVLVTLPRFPSRNSGGTAAVTQGEDAIPSFMGGRSTTPRGERWCVGEAARGDDDVEDVRWWW